MSPVDLTHARWLALPHHHGKRPLPAVFRGRVVAHRGLHSVAPENSMAALQAAAERGLPVELDVRLSRDGVPVVFHDADTARLTGVAGLVADSTAAELARLRLLHRGQPTRGGVPALEDVLRNVDAPLIVELKQETAADRGLERPVIDVLRRAGASPGRVIVESFNPFVLWRLRQLDPTWLRVQLSAPYRDAPLDRMRRFLLRNLMLNGYSRPDGVALEASMLTPWMVRRLRDRLGYEVLAWTAKSAAEADSLFARGVATVIADLDDELLARASMPMPATSALPR